MKSQEATGPIDELSQLLRLRDRRVEAAEKEMREQREVRDQAQREADAANEGVRTAEQNLIGFRRYLSEASGEEYMRMGEFITAHVNALQQAIYRARSTTYRLEKKLEEEQASFLEAQQAWMKEQARRESVATALGKSKRAKRLGLERQADEELADLPRRGSSAAWGARH